MLRIEAKLVQGQERFRELKQARRESLRDMHPDDHALLLRLQEERDEIHYAYWSARRIQGQLRQVVEGGGDFAKGGNKFIRLVGSSLEQPLETAITLASDESWVDAQLATFRVTEAAKPAARGRLAQLMVELITDAVGRGY